MIRFHTLAMLAGTAVLYPVHSGFAQETDNPAVIQLERVIVTARKRQEDPRDIPFSLDVKSVEEIAARRDTDLREVLSTSTSVNVVDNGDRRGTVFNIRGLAPLGGVPGNVDDTSVLTFIDGVPQPLYGTDAQTLDVERVEVLKGPQSTLFGRNTLGGAISIVPVAPSFERELSVRTEIGTDFDRRVEIVGGGTIVPDLLAGRIALRHTGQDGFVPNILGDELGAQDAWAGRASLLWTPSAQTSVTLSLNGETGSESPSYFAWREGPDYPTAAVTHAESDRRLLGATLKVEHDFEPFRLTSTSAIVDNDLTLDTDDADALLYGAMMGAPLDAYAFDNSYSDWRERETKLFQEFRLNSQEGATSSWVAGLSAYRDVFDLDYDNANVMAPMINGRRINDYQTTGIAAFAETTIPLAERLDFSLGGRVSHEHKDYEANYTSNGFPGTVPAFRSSGSLNDTFWTGRVGLSYALSEDISLFGTVARGYKTGGFPRFTNDAYQGVAPTSYRPATSLSYETGLKSEWLDGRLKVDVSAFLNDVKDEQLFAIDRSANTFRTYNGDARSYGLELSGAYEFLDGLTVGGALTVMNAETRKLGADVLLNVPGIADGNHLVQAPRFSAAASLEYRRTVDWFPQHDSEISMRLDYRYVGERFADIANVTELEDYNLVDARIGIEIGDGEFYAYGRNLLDERYDVNAVNYVTGVVSSGTPARGRTVGIGTSWKF